MLSPEQSKSAAARVWACWQEGSVIPSLPDDLRPADRAEGYAIQAHYEQLSGRPLFGWKIAATSTAGQQHIGVDGPIAGRLLAEHAFEDGTTLNFGHNRMAVAEPEFAFRLGQDLPPRDGDYQIEEVMAAVDTLHPAIEIPDSRFERFEAAGAGQLIADNACTHDFVVGPAMPDRWRTLDLSGHTVRIAIAGKQSAEGTGANVLGDPRIALAWIANELSRFGPGLRAGQTITTSTCATPLPVAPGDRVTADFGELGAVGLRFAEADAA